MTYYDYYLKFTDEAQATSILYTTTITPEVLDEEGTVIAEEAVEVTPNYDNIDTIGIIYEDQPIPDPDNPPPPIPTDGWHVNVRNYTQVDELLQYTVHPALPRRVWAGYNPPPMEETGAL